MRSGYPKLSEYLNHVITGTFVTIAGEEGYIYMGTVGDYFCSGISEENLILMQARIVKGELYVEVVRGESK